VEESRLKRHDLNDAERARLESLPSGYPRQGRSCGGLTSKINLLTDSGCSPRRAIA
jgi:hypothetical protein